MNTKHLKPLLKEMMTCTSCGQCKVVCPAFEDLGWDSASARGYVLLSYGLCSGDIRPDASVVERLYQCTTCNQCIGKCPSLVKILDVIEAARSDLVANGYLPPKYQKIIENVRKTGNPFGELHSRLLSFGLSPKKAQFGYFMGCSTAYRETGIAKATLSILNKLKIDFTVIDEVCCGSVLWRIGASEEELKKCIEYNLKEISKLEIKTLLTSCPGCLSTIKRIYPKYTPLDFEVLHITQFLATQNLNFKAFPKTITYHDPCHLGREMKIYEAPRNILKCIPNINFKEMERNRADAKCCGGGGGMRIGFPELASRISERRVAEAKFVELLVSSCPFCLYNMKNNNQDVEVKDIVELVDELI